METCTGDARVEEVEMCKFNVGRYARDILYFTLLIANGLKFLSLNSTMNFINVL